MESTFGMLIRQARKEKGLSQRELAKLAKVNYTYLSKLENDHAGTPPSEEVIERLADHLALSSEDLRYLAGRITAEDERVWQDFIKQNYQQMPGLFRKMKRDPGFVREFLRETAETDSEE
jgi:HTH-type transcriptional regulator, competence development regulator